MKRKITLAVLSFSALLGLSALAQNPANFPPRCVDQKQCPVLNGDSCTKLQAQRQHRGQHMNAFAGIELTAEQWTAIKNLHAEDRAQHHMRRKDYLEKMKKILSPEQYVTYLENLATDRHKLRRPKMHRRNNANCQNCPVANTPENK